MDLFQSNPKVKGTCFPSIYSISQSISSSSVTPSFYLPPLLSLPSFIPPLFSILHFPPIFSILNPSHSIIIPLSFPFIPLTHYFFFILCLLLCPPHIHPSIPPSIQPSLHVLIPSSILASLPLSPFMCLPLVIKSSTGHK